MRRSQQSIYSAILKLELCKEHVIKRAGISDTASNQNVVFSSTQVWT